MADGISRRTVIASGGGLLLGSGLVGRSRGHAGASRADEVVSRRRGTDTGRQQSVTERWRTPLDGDNDANLPAVVADGTVVAVEQLGGEDRLHAVAAADGTERWTLDVGTEITDAMAAAAGHVFVPGEDGVLRAVALDDGDRVWRRDVSTISGRPTVADGTVFVSGGDDDTIAIDVATGEEQWRYSTSECYGGQNSPPAVADGSLFATDDCGGVFELDAATGDERAWWAFDADNEASVATVVAGDLVLATAQVADGDRIYAYAVADATERWRVDTGTELDGPPAVAGDTVLVAGGDGVLRAYALSDGRERWRRELSTLVGSPAVSGRTVFVSGGDDDTIAIDVATGEEQWRYSTSECYGGQNSPPAVAGGSVYVTDDCGALVALDAGPGTDATLCLPGTDVPVGTERTTCLTLRGFTDGFAGALLVLTFPSVVEPQSVTVDDRFGLADGRVDGQDVRIRVADTDDTLRGRLDQFELGCVTVRGVATGEGTVAIATDRVDDDGGEPVGLALGPDCGQFTVTEPTCPTVGGTRTTDPDRDGLCEDVNGNGRRDFDDVTTFFDRLTDPAVEDNVSAFDFNDNGRVDFDDVNSLFDEVR